ncbi:hypothetical protein GCM10009676_44760 [Prauserella halophila]|uniref:PE-PGRS family protein n=1 Tax=Prauserella halophila TaxID=185641 RepID=A0ABN1WLN4_9PSEU
MSADGDQFGRGVEEGEHPLVEPAPARGERGRGAALHDESGPRCGDRGGDDRGGEHQSRRGQDEGHGGAGGDQYGADDERWGEHARQQVADGVGVADEAAVVRAAAQRGGRPSRDEHAPQADAQCGGDAERGVVGDEPFGVVQRGPGQAEGAHADHGDAEHEDRRLLRCAGDEPARRGRQRDPGEQRTRPERDATEESPVDESAQRGGAGRGRGVLGGVGVLVGAGQVGAGAGGAGSGGAERGPVVGGDDDGAACACRLVDELLDAAGVACVQVRGGFVEQQQPCACAHARQGPGDGEASALADRERGDGPVGEPVEAEAVQQVVGVGGVECGGGEGDLGGGAPGERGRLGSPADAFAPGVGVEVGEGDAGDLDVARVGADEAEEDGEGGALAGAARRAQPHGLPCSRGERLAVGGVAAAAVDAQVPHPDVAAARGQGAVGGCGFGEHVGDAADGFDAVGAGVERGADGPQRREALGCEQEHAESDRERHVATGEAHADDDGDEGDRQGRGKFEGEGRAERDAQGAEGGAAVPVGDAADGVGLRVGAAERGEYGQGAHEFEDVGRQPGDGIARRRDAVAGVGADERAEQRQQRQGDGDEQGRGPVGDEHGRTRGEGHDGGGDERREVAGEVGVERIEAGGGECGEFAGAAAGDPFGAESERVVEDVGAQLLLGARGGPGGDDADRPRQHGPRDDGGQEQAEPGREVAGAFGSSPGHDVGEHGGEQERLRDEACGVEEREHAGCGQRSARRR